MQLLIQSPEDKVKLIDFLENYLRENPIMIDNVVTQLVQNPDTRTEILARIMERADPNVVFTPDIIKEGVAVAMESRWDTGNEQATQEIIKDAVYESVNDHVTTQQLERQITEAIESKVDDELPDVDALVSDKLDESLSQQSIDTCLQEAIDSEVDNLDVNSVLDVKVASVVSECLPPEVIRDFTNEHIGEVLEEKVDAIFSVQSLEDRISNMIQERIHACLPLKYVQYLADSALPKITTELTVTEKEITKPKENNPQYYQIVVHDKTKLELAIGILKILNIEVVGI